MLKSTYRSASREIPEMRFASWSTGRPSQSIRERDGQLRPCDVKALPSTCRWHCYTLVINCFIRIWSTGVWKGSSYRKHVAPFCPPFAHHLPSSPQTVTNTGYTLVSILPLTCPSVYQPTAPTFLPCKLKFPVSARSTGARASRHDDFRRRLHGCVSPGSECWGGCSPSAGLYSSH